MRSLARSLRAHWPEVLIEAGGLGLFMVSAGVFATLLYSSRSPLAGHLPEGLLRAALMGLAMGATAISLIYSPWGRRSGAHFNPSVTLTFLRLGKIEPADALLYIGAQAAGGVFGVLLVRMLFGAAFTQAPVRFVATVPGAAGIGVAFAAEVAISALLMTAVLWISNSRFGRFTGLAAGALVALCITFEAPLSGMSMNPARSFASALPSGIWDGFWIYLIAPPLGMLLAAEGYRAFRGLSRVYCAKLHHSNDHRCIFRCRYCELPAAES